MSIKDRENTKLTKEDIDKVRHFEGFPIGSDEDIIALSNPPYYTACPNPFIEDFIKEFGKPYDEETDDYHSEPFAIDISEGKYAPLYKLHAYPTKVPYKAIMHYILHYTNPGDIVFDGFCGTGMTGVAAQLCDMDSLAATREGFSKDEIEKLGERKVILSDLSPTATFISSCYNQKKDVLATYEKMQEILNDCEKKYGWMYSFGEDKIINYIVWSKKKLCSNCGSDFSVWDRTIIYDFNSAIGSVVKEPKCRHCGIILDIPACENENNLVDDNGEVRTIPKYIPVLVNYKKNGKRYEEIPNEDIYILIDKVNQMHFEYWYPHNLMMNKKGQWGDYYRAGYHKGIKYIDDFMTKRTLIIYGYLFERIKEEKNVSIRNDLMFICTACFNRTTRMVRYMAQHKEKNVGPLSGTLYMSSIFGEINVISNIRDRLDKWVKAFSTNSHLFQVNDNVRITTQSTTDLRLPENSIDYIFIDPPFGDNLIYSELNHLTDSWLKVIENIKNETIVSYTQNKDNEIYKKLMRESLSNMYKALKPSRWITIEFHNSKNAIWNIIHSAVTSSGFIIADVRTLDKKKGTTKQMIYTSSVKQDLVISAYKPKDYFKNDFLKNAGNENTVWMFIRQHLENLPRVVVVNNCVEVIAERQAFLLFDRMVSYHLVNNISVPLDAADFYRGLDEKFLKRDGMYFLQDQVNEYDHARLKMDVEFMQMVLFVNDEKTAIAWLYQQLNTPQTYAEIQPKFMKEIRSIEKHELLPELAVLLEDNFLKDENGKWYIPDTTKAADVMKLREKRLVKEFEEYLNSKGKLKKFRTEAVRAGFAKLWKEKNYNLIVKTADRLPDKVIQEDDKLLMYYDISLSRVE
ncbi:DNA methylase [Anaerovirgula multivorans]|uniref:DNA methylase n=1 Tax=Anaerovirgula multivorans TaxID=312168 RepID=A0A239KWQ0_9FIRM|nr:DNA methyltransferase [Anaerovirgula multivorans]SNT21684.1 DNA methylase [Anaerovirgula multivorans]